MRGHGSTVVAPSLERAVYRAVYTEVNAKILADALRIGSVEYLSLEEAHAACDRRANRAALATLESSGAKRAVTHNEDLDVHPTL